MFLKDHLTQPFHNLSVVEIEALAEIEEDKGENGEQERSLPFPSQRVGLASSMWLSLTENHLVQHDSLLYQTITEHVL